MEQITYLEQFKQEIQKLIFENVNELSKVAVLNTQLYQNIIRHILGEVTKEAEVNKAEESYLIEIRKLWQLHIFSLDSVRYIYDHLKFKKLPRPKDFIESTLPAYIELKGSVVPSNNSFIVLDENQQLYWQYLEFAKILEGAMIVIEFRLSEKLGVKTNFESVENTNPEYFITYCKLGDEFMIDLVYMEPHILKKEVPSLQNSKYKIQPQTSRITDYKQILH